MELTPYGQVEPLRPPTVGLVIDVSKDMVGGRVSQLRIVTSRTTFLHDFTSLEVFGALVCFLC